MVLLVAASGGSGEEVRWGRDLVYGLDCYNFMD